MHHQICSHNQILYSQVKLFTVSIKSQDAQETCKNPVPENLIPPSKEETTPTDSWQGGRLEVLRGRTRWWRISISHGISCLPMSRYFQYGSSSDAADERRSEGLARGEKGRHVKKYTGVAALLLQVVVMAQVRESWFSPIRYTCFYRQELPSHLA